MAAPFGLTVPQVLKLTRRQAARLYLRRRDEWGRLREDDEPPPATEDDRGAALRALCLGRGWPDWLTEKWLAKQGADDGAPA